MTNIDKKHLELIKSVNEAKTEHQHIYRQGVLNGWREAVRFCGKNYDWTLADLHHEGEDAKRDMVLGVFSDWKPEQEPNKV